MENKKLKIHAKEIAQLILELSFQGHTGHVGSSLSLVELLTAIYFDGLKSGDKFILSKGHAAQALYATLYKKRILTKNELNSFAKDNGLCEHPMIESNGVEMTTGSLGHGLPFAVGKALAFKRLKKNNRMFVLISDGECDEGSVWEAALLASHLGLNNLVVIVDFNGWQCIDKIENVVSLEPFAEKWISFGFKTRIIDGHDLKQITKALAETQKNKKNPTVIIAKTKTGNGVSDLEDSILGHHLALSEQQFAKAQEELK